RGAVNAQTFHNLLTIAYGIPVRDKFDELTLKSQPVKKEMVSYAEVQEARMLALLDLDLRQMSSDKGLLDMKELEELLKQERGRYSVVQNQYVQQWDLLQKGASD